MLRAGLVLRLLWGGVCAISCMACLGQGDLLVASLLQSSSCLGFLQMSGL
jgi:hypothetical protein